MRLDGPRLNLLLAAGLLFATARGRAEEKAAAVSPRLVAYATVPDQGRERELKLHVFEPPSAASSPAAPRPALLLFHGGGWDHGSPESLSVLARRFAEAGLVVFCPEYRFIGLKGADNGNTVFDSVSDARAALRHLRRHAVALGIDPQRIVVAGGSAGGHLAAATVLFPGDAADAPAPPAALVLFNPVIDTSASGYGNKKLGDRWRELSPLHHVRGGLPPTILFHGTADRTTPFRGAQKFAAAMQAAGNTCELHAREGGDHGYARKEPDATEVFTLAAAFLRAQGVLP